MKDVSTEKIIRGMDLERLKTLGAIHVGDKFQEVATGDIKTVTSVDQPYIEIDGEYIDYLALFEVLGR